jgi:P4 family phage/plasmid primase-like protien
MGLKFKGCDEALVGGADIKCHSGEEAVRIVKHFEKDEGISSDKENDDEEEVPSPVDLAEEYLLERELVTKEGSLVLRHYQNEFLRYNGKCYEKVSEHDFNSDVVRYLQSVHEVRYMTGERLKRDVIVIIKAITNLDSSFQVPSWISSSTESKSNFISMNNGLLNLSDLFKGSSKPLMEHTPAFFTTSILPYDFKPDATCPVWLTFLAQVLPDPSIRQFLQEWMGYNLTHDTSQEKFVLALGEGENGKTVVATVMREVIGLANVSAVGLEAFSPSNRFALAQTFGKLANIVEELNEIGRVEEGELKKFVTGGLMSAERKYKDPFTFIPTARITFATNVFPPFIDRSKGIWRRLIPIPFEVQVPEEKQNKNLIKPLFWRESGELSGIFNWALCGLARLRERGYFEEPQRCKDLKADYKLICNPAKDFLINHFVEAVGKKVLSRNLYEEYRSWAESQGVRPLRESSFCQEVKRTFPTASRTPNAVRQPGGIRSHEWIGIQSKL